MATANDLRRGMAINYNGDICVVLDMQHRTPGNLRAFVQATLRSIRTGKSSDVRFSSTERIEPVPMITKKMEFSYKDGEDYVFTDPETYETVTLAAELVGDAKNYLVENGHGDGDVRRGKGGDHRIAVERGVDGDRRAGRHPRRFVEQRPESRSRWKPASRCRRRCSSRPARKSRWTRAPANTWNAPDGNFGLQNFECQISQSPPRAGFFILQRELLFKAARLWLFLV